MSREATVGLFYMQTEILRRRDVKRQQPDRWITCSEAKELLVNGNAIEVSRTPWRLKLRKHSDYELALQAVEKNRASIDRNDMEIYATGSSAPRAGLCQLATRDRIRVLTAKVASFRTLRHPDFNGS